MKTPIELRRQTDRPVLMPGVDGNPTKAQAQAWARDIEGQLLAGVAPVPADRPVLMPGVDGNSSTMLTRLPNRPGSPGINAGRGLKRLEALPVALRLGIARY